MLEAINKARQAWKMENGDCLMCTVDDPVFGVHRGLVRCTNETKFYYRHALARIFKVEVGKVDRWMDEGKLSTTTDSLGRRCCGFMQVRHFIDMYGLEPEQVVDELRRSIFATYQEHPHAFERGCGRETMTFWIYRTVGKHYSNRVVRRELDALVKEGIFTKGVNHSGHTTYHWRQDG